MGLIKLDFTVAAPVEHVWNFGLQTEKIPEWQFDVIKIWDIGNWNMVLEDSIWNFIF